MITLFLDYTHNAYQHLFREFIKNKDTFKLRNSFFGQTERLKDRQTDKPTCGNSDADFENTDPLLIDF